MAVSAGAAAEYEAEGAYRLRQLPVGVPDTNVVHVAGDVKITRVLVPSGDGPARRRARQSRRNSPEGRGDLHLARVVVLSEKTDVAVGCGRERDMTVSVDQKLTRGLVADAQEAVSSSASETSLIK